MLSYLFYTTPRLPPNLQVSVFLSSFVRLRDFTINPWLFDPTGYLINKSFTVLVVTIAAIK